MDKEGEKMNLANYETPIPDVKSQAANILLNRLQNEEPENLNDIVWALVTLSDAKIWNAVDNLPDPDKRHWKPA